MPKFADFQVRFAPVIIDPAEAEPLKVENLSPRASALLGLSKAASMLLLLALLYTAFFAKSLLIPIVLAAFLSMCLSPLVIAATKVVPRGIAAALVVVGALGLTGLLGSSLIGPAQEFVADAPRAARSVAPKLKALAAQLAKASRATESIVALGSQAPSVRATAPAQVGEAVTLWSAIAGAPKMIANVFSVVLLVYFFLLYGDTLLRRSVELSPTFHQKRSVVAIVRAIQCDTSRYLLTTTLINISLGVATGLLMWSLGVQEPWLWGALAAVLNFIPYIGPFITTAVLAFFGLVNADTLGAALLPAGCFVALTTIEGQIISPAILGRHLSLSPVAILLWLMTWGWLWGIPGVLLGVPMLMVLKIVCDRLDAWRWVARAIE